MSIIMIGGIHGVGKSTACNLVTGELGIPAHTASQIIKDENASAVSTSSKLVANIANNQRVLIQGVAKLGSAGTMLLDGHFAVQRKADGGIEPIDKDVFRQLMVRAIIVLTDTPSAISERLLARDNVTPSPEVLQRLQEAEVGNAQHVASALHVPIAILSSGNIKAVIDVIKEWKARGLVE